LLIFYIKSLGVVIEIDGCSHNDKIEYDEYRDKFLESFGLLVIHVKDEDVKNNIRGVLSYLSEIIKERIIEFDV
jgi:very-short-patch-repair endonuclease